MADDNLSKEEKEKISKYQKEIKKYLDKEKKKKPYGLYLTEEDVEIIKKHIKVPLSKVVDDFIKMMSISIQKIEVMKKENDKKKEEQNDG